VRRDRPGLPHARRQRCLIHRCSQLIAKVSEIDQNAVRADFWEIFDIGDEHRARRAGGDRGTPSCAAVRSHLGQGVPGRGRGVIDTLDELVAHLHYPRAHWPRIRHTNLIERTFGETRRRVKVIGRLPGERSALSLLFAVLDRAAGGWRGITYTPADVRLLQMIRRDLGLTTSRKEHPEPDPHRDVADVA
jgi:transposase-like protein